MSKISELSLTKIVNGIKKKDLSSEEVTKSFIDSSRKSKKLNGYRLYGPTCDSIDYMKGPFLLPNNLKEGDYIEIGQLGAYSLTFRTKFNGFYSDKIFEVQDAPIMSMYEKDSSSHYLVA